SGGEQPRRLAGAELVDVEPAVRVGGRELVLRLGEDARALVVEADPANPPEVDRDADPVVVGVRPRRQRAQEPQDTVVAVLVDVRPTVGVRRYQLLARLQDQPTSVEGGPETPGGAQRGFDDAERLRRRALVAIGR